MALRLTDMFAAKDDAETLKFYKSFGSSSEVHLGHFRHTNQCRSRPSLIAQYILLMSAVNAIRRTIKRSSMSISKE